MPLSTSERINLIRQIEPRLVDEDWPLIDLTLEQFGLPTYETWNGTKQAYILQALKHADENVVEELARHVGIESNREADPKIEPPFWETGSFRLFVSHLAAHRKFVGQFQESLSRFDVSAFVAHNDIEPTTEWQSQIELALATCNGLVALLHPEFHVSSWTDQEIGYVMGRGLPAFSVRLGQDPYGFIGRFQAFNGTGRTATELADMVFHALRTNKETAPTMANVLISLFEKSGSFAAARERVGYIEDLEPWKSSYNSRLESAVKNNSQISESWGVAARVETLLKKHGG